MFDRSLSTTDKNANEIPLFSPSSQYSIFSPPISSPFPLPSCPRGMVIPGFSYNFLERPAKRWYYFYYSSPSLHGDILTTTTNSVLVVGASRLVRQAVLVEEDVALNSFRFPLRALVLVFFSSQTRHFQLTPRGPGPGRRALAPPSRRYHLSALSSLRRHRIIPLGFSFTTSSLLSLFPLFLRAMPSLSQHLVTPTDQQHCQERQRPLALADVDAQIRGFPEWRRWRTLSKVPSANFGVIMLGAGCLPLIGLHCDTYPTWEINASDLLHFDAA